MFWPLCQTIMLHLPTAFGAEGLGLPPLPRPECHYWGHPTASQPSSWRAVWIRCIIFHFDVIKYLVFKGVALDLQRREGKRDYCVYLYSCLNPLPNTHTHTHTGTHTHTTCQLPAPPVQTAVINIFHYSINRQWKSPPVCKDWWINGSDARAFNTTAGIHKKSIMQQGDWWAGRYSPCYCPYLMKSSLPSIASGNDGRWVAKRQREREKERKGLYYYKTALRSRSSGWGEGLEKDGPVRGVLSK